MYRSRFHKRCPAKLLSCYVVLSACQPAVVLSQSIEPVGPSGWTLRNWVGFFLYLGIFVLVVAGICYLDKLGDAREEPDPAREKTASSEREKSAATEHEGS